MDQEKTSPAQTLPAAGINRRPLLEDVIRYLAFGFSSLFFFLLIGGIGTFFAVLSGTSEKDAVYGPRILFILIGLIVISALVTFFYKFSIKHYDDEMQRKGGGRYDTALKYLFLGIAADLLIYVTVGATGCEYVLKWPDALIMLLIPPVIGIIFGLRKPSGYPSGRAIPVLIVSVIAGIGLIFLANCVFLLMPHQVDYRTDTVQFWEYPTIPPGMIQRMMPPTGKNVRITGTAGINYDLDWQCSTDEKTVTDWLTSMRCKWVENDWSYNANPNTNAEKIWFDTLFKFPNGQPPTSFLFYGFRNANNGGWYFAYDRDAHVLYGHYSSF